MASSPPTGISSLFPLFPVPPSKNVAMSNFKNFECWPFSYQPVLLLVGPERYGIYVHEEFLTSVSEYFRAALDTRVPANLSQSRTLSAGFIESITKVIELKEDDVEDLRYFVQWLYSTRSNSEVIPFTSIPSTKSPSESDDNFIPTAVQARAAAAHSCPTTGSFAAAKDALKHKRINPHLNEDSRKAGNLPSFGPLIRLYFLADRLCVPDSVGLKDHILDQFQWVAITGNVVPTVGNVRDIYEGTKTEEEYMKDGKKIKMTRKRNRFRQLVLDLFRVLLTHQVLLRALKESQDIILTDKEDKEITNVADHTSIAPLAQPDPSPMSSTATTRVPTPENLCYDTDMDPENVYPSQFITDLLADCLKHGVVRAGKGEKTPQIVYEDGEYGVKRDDKVTKGWMGLTGREARCLYHEHDEISEDESED